MSELRHAFRSIFRTPTFALAALLTIVLGVGANTAVYTVVNSVLLEPLPFRQPQNLVQVWETHPELHNLQVSAPDYLDWKKSIQRLDLAAYSFQAINKGTLLGQGDPTEVHATMASADLFTVLGVQPLLGRAYDSRQEQAKDPVVLISEKLWRNKFAADPQIVGRSLHLDTTSYTIVGVLGQKEAFPVWADVWMPLSLLEPALLSTRKFHPLEVVGRLKPGVSLRQAELETETVAQGLSAAYPATNGKIGAFLLPLMEQVTGQVRPALVAVWMAVGLVLLIACANLAHLAMARSFNRRRDVALRLALGATRMVAVREFFLETVILSLAGGLLGMLFAAGTLPVLRNLAEGRIPRLEGLSLNVSGLGFGLLISLLVALLFAAPACWQVMRADLNDTMRSGDVRGASARGSWVGPFLLSSEIALSLAVLMAATMLVRSFALTLVAIRDSVPAVFWQ
jgi:predicted permease